MNRKLTLGVAAASLALFVSACSSTAEPVNSDTSNKASDSDLTLEEVFAKSVEAGEEITSVNVDMSVDQNTVIPGEDTSIKTSSDVEMEMVVEPLGLHQKAVTSAEGLTEGEEPITVESYLTEEGFFMYDFMEDQWMKLPADMSDQIIEMSKTQGNPNEQLKSLEQFTDDFTFEQDESSYILTLNASGEKFREFLIEQTENMMPEMGLGSEMEEVFQDTSFEDVIYEIVIDKETFLPSQLETSLIMTMDVEGESLQLEQNTESTYKEYNTIDSIEVPDEVIENAVESP
ncbi:hypothetical protein E2R51_00205 [Jeotgalibacillus sp. S-D1]|uniref:DUF6612 family protein n=1 Tax=Jeotgalibacillus sp. S-D1 TaxID=2552189 RepID=UPI001059FEDA|nr:DUF6612 family protein [Jeotgalibacillus sp. S-D1]TDL34179.1 hypothetical protein E2R51_00205 [Jeotgalibacillus sp. S-D1]